MKKKVLMILFCGVLLFGITGCNDKAVDEKHPENTNTEEKENVEDGAEKIIYQFNDYVQSKDAESMSKLFNEKYVVTKDKLYYSQEELQGKFEQVFDSDFYKSYSITDIHKVTNESDFNKYFKESSEVDYEKSILRVANVYGENTLIYIVDVKYNDESSQDIIYLTKDNDNYTIERSTVWSYMIATFINNFSLSQ